MIKNGSRGEDVTALQNNLKRLGFNVEPDGIFGPDTDRAVRNLQEMFGYSVDGMVGPGTEKLIAAQISYGWNVNAPDAKEKAAKAQGAKK